MRFPEHRSTMDESILGQWRPVSEALRSGRVLSRKDLEEMLNENGGTSAVRRLLTAINTERFSAVVGVPVSILAITRRGDQLAVGPVNRFDGSKPRLYVGSEVDIEEAVLQEAAVRAVTQIYTVSVHRH